MKMGMSSSDAKMKVLDEIEQLLGNKFASKLPKPDAAILEVKAEGSPEEEALESPEEEKKEMAPEMSDDDRIHDLMSRMGKAPGEDDDEYGSGADGDESLDSSAEDGDPHGDEALIQKLMLMKKLR